MDFEQAERHYRKLKVQWNRGELDEHQFRFEVAKLMFQDEKGVFWMIDADDGTWFCNQGDSWEPGDPRAEHSTETEPATTKHGRRLRRATLVLALAALLGLGGVLIQRQWSLIPWDESQATPTVSIQIQVTIASPADGSQVALDQAVAVESTIQTGSGLQAVDRVELRVNGQTIDSQPVRPKLQPEQTSLPLSQPWLPTNTGEHQVTVAAVSSQGDPLGAATITLNVAEASEGDLPEPACTPDAIFVTDVTIPAGTEFRPETQMEKVWQVRNSGTCAWGVGYGLSRIGGEALSALDQVAVPPTAAGQPVDLTITLQAPSEAGTYTNTWQLHSPDGTPFGPTLTLSFEVKIQAEENLPPDTPTDLKAAVTENGSTIRLTWQDRSETEDAFRVYREDVEASIGLAPANAQFFVDNSVNCGGTYRYGVVAFNAAGASTLSEIAEASLPPCTPADAPPTLVLTVVPTQVVASEPITIVFQAVDDVSMAQVTVRGEETGDASLDAGRTFPCSEAVCAGSWPFTPTAEISTSLTLVAVALDSSGQESEPARMTVTVRPQP